MAASTVIKNFRDSTIRLFDGATPTPAQLEVTLEAGDFSLSGLSSTLHEVTPYLDRGELATLRKTNRTFPTGSWTCHFADLSDGSDQTMTDFLLKGGSYGGNVSTLPGEVYCVKIQLDIEGTDHGDTAGDHQITLDDCHVTLDYSDGDPSSLSASFVVYGAITMS